MKGDKKKKRLVKSIKLYLAFFVFIAFIVTCNTVLFLNILSKSLDIVYNEENITFAAKMTFGNVVFLALMITVFDIIRRRIAVKRPVDKIMGAVEKVMEGDFNARVPRISSFFVDENFKEIGECFNKMAAELSSIETLRTDFVSNVSHEIKTPLSVIQNYVSLLSQSNLTVEQRKEYSKQIIDATRRLSDLITNILKLNKLENQQILPNVQVYNLGEQLCECLLNFENVWEEKNINIVTRIDDDVLIKNDSEMLNMVWNNLFSNAFKFTGIGGTVTLTMKKVSNAAVVTVTDTGCGISRKTGEHIFDKFYQGDTSHAVAGNGLGLALVKRIIDITGSEITVESEVGKGSSFSVKLWIN